MGHCRHSLIALTLLAWIAVAIPGAPAGSPAGEPTGSLPGSAPGVAGVFDRGAAERELARSSVDLRNEPGDALRAYLARLETLRAALDAAPDASAAERRSLGDLLLARAVEVGLILRQRAAGEAGSPSGSGERRAGVSLLPRADLAGILADNSILLVGLLGGLVVVFALGTLVGYRRGTQQATYYGEGDPRIRFLAQPAARQARRAGSAVIPLSRIRETLGSGRPVQLQLGYEVAPTHRLRFMELVRQVRQVMEGAEGQRYAVWEDPRHPNRFYEVLVCTRTAALAPLTDVDGPLARIAEEIEKCRVPGGAVVRRVWWGALPPEN